MATNAELTEENAALRARVEELENQIAVWTEREDAVPAAPAANAGPHRMSFQMSQGTANDLQDAARATKEDGKRRVVKDVGSGFGWAVSLNADGEVQVQALQDQEPEAFMDDEQSPDN